MTISALKTQDQNILAYKNNQIIYLGNVEIKNWDELSPTQLKIAMYSAGKVKLEDTHETKYTMTFQEYAALCKLEASGGSIYEQVYKEARKLAKLGVDFIDTNGDTVIFNWLTSVRISPKSGTVTYKLDEALLPFYKTRKGRFAIINLLDYMPLKGRYTLLLYEFLSMWQNAKDHKVYQTIEQLRMQLQVPEEKYKRPYDFVKQIINRAVAEINEKTRYTFRVQIKTKSGKHNTVEGITFYINSIEKLETLSQENQDLIEILESMDVKPKTVIEICRNSEYSRDRIFANIKLAQKRYNEGKADSLQATTISAIKEDWAEIQQLSPATITKRQKQQEAKAEYKKIEQIALLEIEEQANQSTSTTEVTVPEIKQLKEKWEKKFKENQLYGT